MAELDMVNAKNDGVERGQKTYLPGSIYKSPARPDHDSPPPKPRLLHNITIRLLENILIRSSDVKTQIYANITRCDHKSNRSTSTQIYTTQIQLAMPP